MIVKRTAVANTPKGAAWVSDYYDRPYPYADEAYVAEYPTHSPILGPDGKALKYEPRQAAGFDLRPSDTSNRSGK